MASPTKLSFTKGTSFTMQPKDFTRQFYANRPSEAMTAKDIQKPLEAIVCDPQTPMVSHQIQSLQARPGMTEEQMEDCSELGWSLAPPPLREVL
jgi:hypothetical protein